MSSRPRVTITLGHRGQAVKNQYVSDSDTYSAGTTTSRVKRPMSERLGTTNDDTQSGGGRNNKRQRVGNLSSRLSYGGSADDAKVGSNGRLRQGDLRLKLMRKNMFQRRTNGDTKRNKTDLRERPVPRYHSEDNRYGSEDHMPGSTSGFSRQITPSRNVEGFYQPDPVERASPFFPVDGPRHRAPSPLRRPRNYSELRSDIPSFRSSAVSAVPTRDTRPLPYMGTAAVHINMSKPAVQVAPPPGNPMMKLPAAQQQQRRQQQRQLQPMPEEPITVVSLLRSLGLDKYSVLFLAEEVDMTALAQMEENDLKALGIPMGPRKKIILAVRSLLKPKPR